MKHINRKTNRWRVSITRAGRRIERAFGDRKHGGKQNSLAAAQAWRDQISKQHPPHLYKKTSKANKTGAIGIFRLSENRKNGLKEFWKACWQSGGKTKAKRFFISKWGEQEAFARAVAARDNGLKKEQTRIRRNRNDRLTTTKRRLSYAEEKTNVFAMMALAKRNNQTLSSIIQAATAEWLKNNDIS